MKSNAKNKKTEVIRSIDKHGRRIVRVPVGKKGLVALVEEADYNRLDRMGLGGGWFVSYPKRGLPGYLRAYEADASGDQVTIARIILTLGAGESVKYATADKLDLRHTNISAGKGNAKREDAVIATTDLGDEPF